MLKLEQSENDTYATWLASWHSSATLNASLVRFEKSKAEQIFLWHK